MFAVLKLFKVKEPPTVVQNGLTFSQHIFLKIRSKEKRESFHILDLSYAGFRNLFKNNAEPAVYTEIKT